MKDSWYSIKAKANAADATVNVSGQYGTIANNLTGTPTVAVSNAFRAGDVAEAGGGNDVGPF